MTRIPLVPSVGDWAILREGCTLPGLVKSVEEGPKKFTIKLLCGKEADYPFNMIRRIIYRRKAEHEEK